MRPWNSAQFFDLASKTFPGSNVKRISEHCSVDETGVARSFRERMDVGECVFESVAYLDDMVDEVFCKFLFFSIS